MNALALLILICAIGLFVLWGMTKASRARRKAIGEPFPESWRRFVKENVPITEKLPGELQGGLERLIQGFVIDIPFEGAGGLEINEEIRVTIAAQASLLVLRNGRSFSNLRSVVVYPSTYRPVHRDAGGDLVVSQDQNLGESWGEGYVILAWDAVLRGAVDIKDGHNVVLHEFAHQIDQEDDLSGHADGIPVPSGASRFALWEEVIGDELEQLRQDIRRRARTVLDPYGQTNEAELFAVATEAYFEKPKQLAKKSPRLYDLLDELYRLDPKSW